jgi:DNA-binding transcriptional LysR family regulator
MTGTQLKAIKGKILIDGNGGPAVQNPLEGLGLVQGPPIFIATDLAEGRLVTVLDQWAPTPATGFFLYYPSRRQMRAHPAQGLSSLTGDCEQACY